MWSIPKCRTVINCCVNTFVLHSGEVSSDMAIRKWLGVLLLIVLVVGYFVYMLQPADRSQKETLAQQQVDKLLYDSIIAQIDKLGADLYWGETIIDWSRGGITADVQRATERNKKPIVVLATLTDIILSGEGGRVRFQRAEPYWPQVDLLLEASAEQIEALYAGTREFNPYDSYIVIAKIDRTMRPMYSLNAYTDADSEIIFLDDPDAFMLFGKCLFAQHIGMDGTLSRLVEQYEAKNKRPN